MTSLPQIPFLEKLPFLSYTMAGNSLQSWIVALLIGVALSLFLLRMRIFLVTRFEAYAKRTTRHWDDDAASVLARTNTFFLVAVSFYFVMYAIVLPPRLERVADAIVTATIFFQLLLWLDRVLMIIVHRWMKSEYDSHGTLASPKAAILTAIARFVLYVIVLLSLLDNLGVNITALVTGLGVTGVAIALAVQNILGDLFASASIALDKPFEVGDFIVVNEFSGTVEKVGLKTTRVRSVNGEQIVFPNGSLLQSRVSNFKRMSERRIPLNFGLAYDTPAEKIDTAQSIVREAIESAPGVRFERTHCVRFGAASLEFESVFWVLTSRFADSTDASHFIVKRILQRFQEEKIDFASATQPRLTHHAEAKQPPAVSRLLPLPE